MGSVMQWTDKRSLHAAFGDSTKDKHFALGSLHLPLEPPFSSYKKILMLVHQQCKNKQHLACKQAFASWLW